MTEGLPYQSLFLRYEIEKGLRAFYDNHDDDDRDDDHEDDQHLTSKATSPLGATSSLLVLNLLAGKHCIHSIKIQ